MKLHALDHASERSLLPTNMLTENKLDLRSKITHIKTSIHNESALFLTSNRQKVKWKSEYPKGNRTSKAHGGAEKKAVLFIYF